jgi:hypothetical protein
MRSSHPRSPFIHRSNGSKSQNPPSPSPSLRPSPLPSLQPSPVAVAFSSAVPIAHLTGGAIHRPPGFLALPASDPNTPGAPDPTLLCRSCYPKLPPCPGAATSSLHRTGAAATSFHHAGAAATSTSIS